MRCVLGSVFASVLAVSALSCTSSQTSTAITAPASAKCQVQVASAPAAFTADGGKGMLSVATTRDCAWSITTNANWVALANTQGQGEASVPYTVSANPVPVSRAAAIVVSDISLQLNQAAAPCRFAFSPSGASVPSAGGPITVQITTLTGCAWTAATDAAWLTLTSGASGNASGTIGMLVAANSGPARSAQMTAGGISYPVTQADGTPPPAPPPPPPPTLPPTLLSGAVMALLRQCPGVSFLVSVTRVVASASTSSPNAQCQDLRNGKSVSVTGTVQPDLSVAATLINFQ